MSIANVPGWNRSGRIPLPGNDGGSFLGWLGSRLLVLALLAGGAIWGLQGLSGGNGPTPATSASAPASKPSAARTTAYSAVPAPSGYTETKADVCKGATIWLVIERSSGAWKHAGHQGGFTETANGPETAVKYVSQPNGSFKWAYTGANPVGLIVRFTGADGMPHIRKFSQFPPALPNFGKGEPVVKLWVCTKPA
jgi:hypothetical protein